MVGANGICLSPVPQMTPAHTWSLGCGVQGLQRLGVQGSLGVKAGVRVGGPSVGGSRHDAQIIR